MSQQHGKKWSFLPISPVVHRYLCALQRQECARKLLKQIEQLQHEEALNCGNSINGRNRLIRYREAHENVRMCSENAADLAKIIFNPCKSIKYCPVNSHGQEFFQTLWNCASPAAAARALAVMESYIWTVRDMNKPSIAARLANALSVQPSSLENLILPIVRAFDPSDSRRLQLWHEWIIKRFQDAPCEWLVEILQNPANLAPFPYPATAAAALGTCASRIASPDPNSHKEAWPDSDTVNAIFQVQQQNTIISHGVDMLTEPGIQTISLLLQNKAMSPTADNTPSPSSSALLKWPRISSSLSGWPESHTQASSAASSPHSHPIVKAFWLNTDLAAVVHLLLMGQVSY